MLIGDMPLLVRQFVAEEQGFSTQLQQDTVIKQSISIIYSSNRLQYRFQYRFNMRSKLSEVFLLVFYILGKGRWAKLW